MTNGIFGEVHAPLRGAALCAVPFRWVRRLTPTSHRLPSRVPPARNARAGSGFSPTPFALVPN